MYSPTDIEGCRGHKKASDLLDLELQADVRCLSWELNLGPVKEPQASLAAEHLLSLPLILRSHYAHRSYGLAFQLLMSCLTFHRLPH